MAGPPAPWAQLELDQNIPTMYDVVLAVMFYVLGGPCQCRSALGRVCWVGCVGMAALRNHRDRRDASFWVGLDTKYTKYTKYTKGVQFSYSVNLKFHFYKRGISDLDRFKTQHPYAKY